MPGDARMNQFEDPKGASWRVCAVDSFPTGPIVITQVEEVRQQNPPSTWGVYVGNDLLIPPRPSSGMPLKPQQVVRKEVRIRTTVLAPTDRVVFFVKDVVSENGDFRAVDAEVAVLIRQTALRLPVP